MSINNWITLCRSIAIIGSFLGLIGLMGFTSKTIAITGSSLGLIGLIGLAITTRKASKISNNRIIELEKINKSHQDKKKQLEKLKTTIPEVKIISLFIKDDQLKLVFETKNMVPILFNFSINDEQNRIISNSIQIEKIKVFPTKENERFNIPYHSMNQIRSVKIIPMNKNINIKVHLNYESIYYGESRSKELKREVSKLFIANFQNNSFIPV